MTDQKDTTVSTERLRELKDELGMAEWASPKDAEAILQEVIDKWHPVLTELISRRSTDGEAVGYGIFLPPNGRFSMLSSDTVEDAQLIGEDYFTDKFTVRPLYTHPIPIEPVAVKALEWSDPWPDEKTDDMYVSVSLGLAYHVKKTEQWNVTVSYWGAGEPRSAGSFNTLAEAKSAAQADFDQRIRSALQVKP